MNEEYLRGYRDGCLSVLKGMRDAMADLASSAFQHTLMMDAVMERLKDWDGSFPPPDMSDLEN